MKWLCLQQRVAIRIVEAPSSHGEKIATYMVDERLSGQFGFRDIRFILTFVISRLQSWKASDFPFACAVWIRKDKGIVVPVAGQF